MKANPAIRYSGEVVYLYAFDLAYDTSRKPINELLGQPVAQFAVDASKRSPRQLFFYKPQMVRLPPMERIGPMGPVRVERVIKLLPVGAISISVRVPFAVNQFEELVAFHDLQFSNGSLHEEVRRLAQDVAAELRTHLSGRNYNCRTKRRTPSFALLRRYWTINGQLHERRAAGFTRIAIKWPHCSRRRNRWERLSKQEAEESTGRYLSYYDDDLVVLDWDAALARGCVRGISTIPSTSWSLPICSSLSWKRTTVCWMTLLDRSIGLG